MKQYVSEIVNLEEMIPEDHFLRIIEAHFDWNFVYDEVEKLNFGNKSCSYIFIIKQFFKNKKTIHKIYLSTV